MVRENRKKTNALPPNEDAVAEFLANRYSVRARLDNGAQTSLRLPRLMYDALLKAADEHDRGVSEEIRQRLEVSMSENPPALKDPRFADLLTALTRVAAGAARMYPAKQVESQGKIADDISAHWVFEAATQLLLDAFRPEGVPASLPKDPTEARVEAMRRADRLVSAALGALGERGLVAFDRLSSTDKDDLINAGFTREPDRK